MHPDEPVVRQTRLQYVEEWLGRHCADQLKNVIFYFKAPYLDEPCTDDFIEKFCTLYFANIFSNDYDVDTRWAWMKGFTQSDEEHSDELMEKTFEKDFEKDRDFYDKPVDWAFICRFRELYESGIWDTEGKEEDEEEVEAEAEVGWMSPFYSPEPPVRDGDVKPVYVPHSPLPQGADSPAYSPTSPAYTPASPAYSPTSPKAKAFKAHARPAKASRAKKADETNVYYDGGAEWESM